MFKMFIFQHNFTKYLVTIYGRQFRIFQGVLNWFSKAFNLLQGKLNI